MTLDGKIATEKGQSQWITGPDAREEVQRMRQRCDAIMVGGETIKLDNSSLRVQQQNWPQPQRYIWSSRMEWGCDLKAFQNDDNKCAVVIKPQNPEEWHKLLKDMGANDITSLLIEGGGELAASVLNCGIVDQVSFFIAPKILTGKKSRPVIGGPSPLSLDDALDLHNTRISHFGRDTLYEGYLSSAWKCP